MCLKTHDSAETGCERVDICNLRAPMGRWEAEAGEHPDIHTSAYLIYTAERQQRVPESYKAEGEDPNPRLTFDLCMSVLSRTSA